MHRENECITSKRLWRGSGYGNSASVRLEIQSITLKPYLDDQTRALSLERLQQICKKGCRTRQWHSAENYPLHCQREIRIQHYHLERRNKNVRTMFRDEVVNCLNCRGNVASRCCRQCQYVENPRNKHNI